MRRHEVDPVSVLAGLVFLLVAGGYALGHVTDVHVRWLLAVPAGMIVAGAVVVAYVARRMSRSGPQVAEDTSDTVD
jgi:ABC-type sulfate transport system permease subunit